MDEFRCVIAEKTDLDSILKILDSAKTYFKNHSINQWQDGYPNADSILTDISNRESYVLKNKDIVVGTAMISTTPESSYDFIEGNWLTSDPYIVIHRIAIDPAYKGKQLAEIFLDTAPKLFPGYKSIRMDTHLHNLSMQSFLKKNGFKLCGNIYLTTGDLRLAYEKILD